MIKEVLTRYQAEIVLTVILLLSAFLNIWNLWNQGFSNTYYAAAVRSMLANPGIAFFSSFDAAGFITVDKPPVGLWIQAAFAAVLGYTGWVLDLPQALAGIASVALIYVIVARPFGKSAGLIAAFALAITPIFVATARNETMDLQLIFIILLAIWAALEGARKNSFWLFATAMVLVGIGFNIKMIQAFIVVPAILVVYFLGTSIPFRRKAFHIAAAILILLIVSLSWAVVVDLIPKDQRPYIGSSGDNTVFGLILGHNGIERLEHTQGSGTDNGPGFSSSPGNMTTGPLKGFNSQDVPGIPDRGSGTDNMTWRYRNPNSQDTVPESQQLPDGTWGTAGAGARLSGPENQTAQSRDISSPIQDGWQAGAGRQPGGGGIGQGTPSVFRFYESDVASQISWLLPLALIGILAWIRKPATFSMKGLEEAGLFQAKGLTLVAMVLWLLPGLLYFSLSSGFWHTYYLATIAPPLAALVGIGIIGMCNSWKMDGPTGWLLVAAVLVTGLLEVRILLYDSGFAGLLIPLVLVGTIISALLLGLLRTTGKNSTGRLPVAAVLITLAFLSVAPFVWACTPMGYSGGDNLPVAGPQGGVVIVNRIPGGFSSQDTGSGIMPVQEGYMDLQGQESGQTSGGTPVMPDDGNMRSIDSSSTEELTAYLVAHNSGETFLAATSGTHSASGLIIATGKPVMALGGFLGSDQPLTLDEFKGVIRNGSVRYFISPGNGGMDGGTGNSPIIAWVESSCSAVTDLTGSGSAGNVLLYDCEGALYPT